MGIRHGIIAIDEGTTGTRAAWVTADGTVGGLHYERLAVSSPSARVVEQDAAEILRKTTDAVRHAVADAREQGVAVVGLAIATQRATTVLWDTATGEPLVPAIVWQDTRHADELAALAPEWDDWLVPRVGRPVGVRSPYLTAALLIERDERVREAHRAGRLGFGTVDTWLLWNLVQGRPLATSATNATSCGAYLLGEHRYATDYLDALGFPRELLPELHDDQHDFGVTDPAVLGIEVPVVAVLGDQHAGMLGLGTLEAGDAMCVHGTGSFVDLNLGDRLPERPGLYEGALALVAWRAQQRSRYSVETFTAATGSALDWICGSLGWFPDAKAISEAAATASRSNPVQFLPAMTGVRMPVVEPRVKSMLTGFDFSTTKADIAAAVLEGIAQSVAWSLEADAEVAGVEVTSMLVGGGLAQSDPLLQLQADLTQVPQRRLRATEVASLRGAAFLGGIGTLWPDLESAAALLQEEAVFEPRLERAARDEQVRAWRARVELEVRLARAGENEGD
ncbi:FGGY family carbohydrate kinase [Agrococcus sp. HG114]|uniref:FGGY family carbohydrate kinase n=1 Tax=Agrococcus sp. HG114 TaxID=2969757 RepID=UPI00215A325C|nr:FGGY family carbohydrate kinase [Agrococcus sp. HG114]MCR8669608.1 FGGY family carbohydrate kinase [Agrococcus sp. HG114]